MQERGKKEGMIGKETFRLRSGLERVAGKFRENGRRGGRGTCSGPMRAALRKDKGSDKVSGGGSTAMGDQEETPLGVASIYGASEVYHGISPLGVQGSSKKERSDY